MIAAKPKVPAQRGPPTAARAQEMRGMVAVITEQNSALHATAVDAMFRDRKRIFVDWLKWDIPVVNGVYEQDQFDGPGAIYLVDEGGAAAPHLGSVRLLPTSGPYLLGDVFPQLAEAGAPRQEDVWEITRLCTTPALRGDAALTVRRRIAQALVETALLYGVSRYVAVAHVEWLSGIIATGWETRPLGLPQQVNGEMIGAIEIIVTPATLQFLRLKYGTNGPVLELDARRAA
jgi:acyl-homoserine lactone synthase